MSYENLLPCKTPACKRWDLFNYNEKNFVYREKGGGAQMVLIDNGKAMHGMTFLDNSVRGNRQWAERILFVKEYPLCAFTLEFLDSLYNSLSGNTLPSGTILEAENSALNFMRREGGTSWEDHVDGLVSSYLSGEQEPGEHFPTTFSTTNKTIPSISMPHDFASFDYALMGIDHRSNLLLSHVVKNCMSCDGVSLNPIVGKIKSIEELVKVANNYGASININHKFDGCILVAVVLDYVFVNNYDSFVKLVPLESISVEGMDEVKVRGWDDDDGLVDKNWVAGAIATADRISGAPEDVMLGFLSIFFLLKGEGRGVAKEVGDKISKLLNGKVVRLYSLDESERYQGGGKRGWDDVGGDNVKEVDYGRKFSDEIIVLGLEDISPEISKGGEGYLNRFMEFNGYGEFR